MLGDMMVHLTRNIEDPQRRLQEARGLLEKLREERLAPASWRAMLEDEVELLLKRRPGSLWHDDFSPASDPVYFHEFAAHAAANGLQYLGDAELHVMSDLRPIAGAPAGDIIEREQYMDFLFCRRFREPFSAAGTWRSSGKSNPAGCRNFISPRPSGAWRMAGSKVCTA